MWWKQNKWRVIVPVLLLALAAFAFWYGGGAPGLQGWRVEKPAATASGLDERPGGAEGTLSVEEKLAAAAELAGEVRIEQGDADYSAQQGMQLDPESGLDRYMTSAVPEGKPVPVEPQDAEISEAASEVAINRSAQLLGDGDAEGSLQILERMLPLVAEEYTPYMKEMAAESYRRCRQNCLIWKTLTVPLPC